MSLIVPSTPPHQGNQGLQNYLDRFTGDMPFGPVASDPTVSRLITVLAADVGPVLAAVNTARAAARSCVGSGPAPTPLTCTAIRVGWWWIWMRAC